MAKEIVLTHVVKDVSKMKKGVRVYSDEEEHFGISWQLGIGRENDNLGLWFHCLLPDRSKEWSAEIERKFKLISATGKTLEKTYTRCYTNTDKFTGHGPNDFIKWDDLINDYVIDDTITVQVHAKLTNMTEKKKLRNFDESRKQFSDVVLVVEDEKFYVSKLFLAGQSSYFEALFLRNFSESEQSEIKLSDVDSKDFQNFLELLHGEAAIDDTTVNGILNLSDMYNAKTAIRRCEEFLNEKSKKKLKEKLELSTRYKLKNLKNNCLLKINTVDEIKSVLPENLNELDPEISNALLQKFLVLY